MTRQPHPAASGAWLTRYYFLRAAVAAVWVAMAFLFGKDMPALAAMLLVAYPAWDAAANFTDARHSGGLARNPSQAFNVVVSILTAIAVAVALGRDQAQTMSGVFVVFGVWAGIAGTLQLATAVRRWRVAGAQWAMILSGAQSALAGTFFVQRAFGTAPLNITGIAPYAAFGAFYFLLSAILLAVSVRRRAST
ncbi:DUF308 domain-containing protein [Sphingomonas sp. BAUL-RG-20F-R05-02]|uniref:DUF308 domain-containing protein n=1 Tax=Sphingomonas sp. BAUL-RG-20F-R05-02 TaxID=2914830 RepID=UPI001F561F1E|nr:DUF308 domain-containing protein [Sphingomonas sp. BAUL-RG-20F-R05-02]